MAGVAHSGGGLPEGCRLREIDLSPGVGALIAADRDGGVSIYVNARLDPAARQRALRHELRHYRRGDLFSGEDIRRIEGEASGGIVAMGGGALEDPAPVFRADGLAPIGRGLYLPTGANLQKAAEDMRALARALDAACRAYDIAQRPPELPLERLTAACAALSSRPEDAVAFVAWRGDGAGALPVVLQFCASEGACEGAIYYAPNGAPDNAVAMLCADWQGRAFRVCADIRRRNGALSLCALNREVDGQGWERVY